MQACDIVGDELVPSYLTEHDYPWLRSILTEQARYVGERRSAWAERLREPFWPEPPMGKLRVVSQLLERWTRDRTVAAVSPVATRRGVFEHAARRFAAHSTREVVVAEAAAELEVSPEQLEASLFADLPSQRRICALPAELGPAELALRANQALVTSLLSKSRSLSLRLTGRVRPVVRHAQRVGLLCVAFSERGADERCVRLIVSGPLALFRHTRVYGRALASLVPRLAWCDAFQLDAAIQSDPSRTVRLRVTERDPIMPADEPRAFDSKVEEKFATQFARATKDWHIVREPRAVPIGRHLMFPDFELVHRYDPRRCYLMEIVGYWTPEYLSRKLHALRHAAGARWLLCVDSKLGCTEDDFAPGAHVLWFRRHIDVRAVLAHLEGPGGVHTWSA